MGLEEGKALQEGDQGKGWGCKGKGRGREGLGGSRDKVQGIGQ